MNLTISRVCTNSAHRQPDHSRVATPKKSESPVSMPMQRQPRLRAPPFFGCPLRNAYSRFNTVAEIKPTAAPANSQRAAPIFAEGHVTWLAQSATTPANHMLTMARCNSPKVVDGQWTTGDLASPPVGKKKKKGHEYLNLAL